MQKKILLPLVLAVPILLFIWGVFNIEAELPSVLSGNTATLSIGDTILTAEIAGTASKRIKGLSGKLSLSDDIGMLFVFEESDFHGIWMKDMLFPIDIIWIDDDFNIVGIKEYAEPASYPEVFEPKEKAKYILEANAGFVNKYNIEVGDPIAFIQ